MVPVEWDVESPFEDRRDGGVRPRAVGFVAVEGQALMFWQVSCS